MYDKILKKLDKQEKEEGKLPLLLVFYRRLLGVQDEAYQRLGAAAAKTRLSTEVIAERIRNGIPILRFEDLDLDLPRVREVYGRVAAIFRAYPELFGEIPETATPELTEKLVKAWYEGTSLPAGTASELLLKTVLQATLNPFLRRYSEALIGLFSGDSWLRRYCPVCGGSPDFAFLDKERGARWLLCSRCDTQWVYKRLECPYCGNQDQNSLAYFTDEKEIYRLYTCQRCQKYLKAIDLRKTEEDIILPLERLLTADMDRQAQEKGFSSG